ncbi:hypothetical protein WH52_13945 [Tenacibaculum holothuriorum]|uniref:Cytochrome c domain-containing protein n=1 Tax=Tenacibaculum holothuriorum TaxID=1635173 RepID=A0A1Y2PB23_9FLAO|nr:cytochrome c [Tenacibaculum holothuriorum]OSY86997.1 hypothetical protein WH52_13945 [Tenacibaculum holothuriorum]
MNNNNRIDLYIFLGLLAFTIPWIIKIQTQTQYSLKTDSIKVDSSLIKSIIRGKQLFRTESCYSCHKVDKRICFGPRLGKILDRRSKDFLVKFIKNEDSLVKAKHPDVIALKEEYKWANGLHNKKHLTNGQINDIINYLQLFD